MISKKKVINRLVVLLLLAPFALCAQVYKWTDKDGNVHYSDTPRETTDKPMDDLPESMIYKAPPKPRINLDKPKKKEPYKAYKNFKITSPQNDGTVRNPPGNITVSLQISPGLKNTHHVIVMIDGKQVAKGKSTSVSVSNVDRGTHSLSAKIVDGSGKAVASAPSITFHMKR